MAGDGERRAATGPWHWALFLFSSVNVLSRTGSPVLRILAGAATVCAGLMFLREAGNHVRRRLAERASEPAMKPGRPVVGIDSRNRGEWLYSPSAWDGSTEIELRLRRRRYVALFGPDEKAAYRATISAITAALNTGTETVDVNAAFAEAIAREPFEDRGPLPPTLLDRILARWSRRQPRELDSRDYGVD